MGPRPGYGIAVGCRGVGNASMGLSVTFVSGPRGAGKSTLIRGMIDRFWKKEPHYIRLIPNGSDNKRPSACAEKLDQRGIASVRWLEYSEDRIFELLPQALTAIHHQDRFGSVIIEADADPSLRHAYPYDHRIFVMPTPRSVNEVFREPRRAATELQRVLDDTTVFASEIFGLFTDDGDEDVDPHELRPELTDTQMRGFLYSPLGDELATRIQLQPPYHGLVESDVIVVNTDVGDIGPGTDECLRRITRLLERTRTVCGRKEELFLCNPLDLDCRAGGKLLDALKPMCVGGR